MSKENPPDLVLRPRGKVARINRKPIVARVTFGSHDGHYCHPTIEIGHPADSDKDPDWKEFAWYPEPVSVRYQMHRANADDKAIGGYEDRLARGFVAPSDAEWIGPYGGDITGRVSAPAFLCKVIALIERAHEAATSVARGSKAYCPEEFTSLVVGLRRIGVEVRIYNRHLRDTKRRRREILATMREAA